MWYSQDQDYPEYEISRFCPRYLYWKPFNYSPNKYLILGLHRCYILESKGSYYQSYDRPRRERCSPQEEVRHYVLGDCLGPYYPYSSRRSDSRSEHYYNKGPNIRKSGEKSQHPPEERMENYISDRTLPPRLGYFNQEHPHRELYWDYPYLLRYFRYYPPLDCLHVRYYLPLHRVFWTSLHF